MVQKIIFFRLFLLILFVSGSVGAVDLIIFSKDRPLQLELFLRSLQKHVTGLDSVQVLLHTKNCQFEVAYRELADMYPWVDWLHQSRDYPRGDFTQLLLQALESRVSEYVIFGVDDMVMLDDVDLDFCVKKLEETDAYGCQLRMGKNITYSYTYNINLTVPELTPVGDGMFTWSTLQGRSYWTRHHTVCMSIYRASDMAPILQKLNYTNPNTLDGSLEQTVPRLRKALCFEHSKVIMIPMNLVQKVWPNNRHMQGYSVELLLEKWNKGFMVDLDDLYNIHVNSETIEHASKFISR